MQKWEIRGLWGSQYKFLTAPILLNLVNFCAFLNYKNPEAASEAPTDSRAIEDTSRGEEKRGGGVRSVSFSAPLLLFLFTCCALHFNISWNEEISLFLSSSTIYNNWRYLQKPQHFHVMDWITLTRVERRRSWNATLINCCSPAPPFLHLLCFAWNQ